VRAAVGDNRGLPAIGKEDGERFTQEHCPLRAVLEVLSPCDRLPTVAQREGNLLAAWSSALATVKDRVYID
jgi:hypothetical protein